MAGGLDADLLSWDVDSGEQAGTYVLLEGSNYPVATADYSPDGTTLFAYGDLQKGELVRFEGPSHSWAQELYPTIDERTARVNSLSRDHAVHEAAAAAYDEAAVKQGYLLMGIGAGVILLGGLGLIILIAAAS